MRVSAETREDVVPGQGRVVNDDLERLAAAHGVATGYVDWAQRPATVEPEAVVAALAALGVDASTPESVAAALADAEDAPWRRLLPPSVVVRGRGHVVMRSA